ncbi:putative mitochondrial protein AtMg00860 [Silene latifolia]|uniref:putative mitochondrial protein AtMg00860 n=1 Tax=Silene latifolia TaxID=37657 RepID=UPI003D76F943
MEMVKKEILKLLQVGMIYPISDSKWVSPTQVIPKKSGVMVVANQHAELVPTRVQNGWPVCIDYHRLNAVTRKDHFSLPFIDQIVERLAEQGIVLGHVVSSNGIEVDKAKIDTIQSLPYPTNVREVRSFLGQAGFYHSFIKDFSKVASPLCKLLPKNVDLEFYLACKEAFDILKAKLTTTPIIQAPDWSIPFELMCDASDYALGAVLGQKVGRVPHMIYYESMTLSKA